MDTGRSRFQGLKNIIRFNYPMYVAVLVVVAGMAALLPFVDELLYTVLVAGMILAFAQLLLSLGASAWAYNGSGLYELRFLPRHLPDKAVVLNISAGFDEWSGLITGRYPGTKVRAYDFFNPLRHTEPSIRRARAAYPAHPGTRSMSTAKLPEQDASADLICVLLAAHEIRDMGERRAFLSELRRVLKPDGQIVVLEHLRDLPNLLAYNIGALHFFSARQWRSDFKAADLHIRQSRPLNPFIRCFTLMRSP